MEKCWGGQSLSQLCCINQCVSSPVNTETHTAVMSVYNLVFLKAQKFTPSLHFLSPELNLSVKGSISMTVLQNHPRAHISSLPSAYWLWLCWVFLCPGYICTLPLSVPNPNMFPLLFNYMLLYKLFWHVEASSCGWKKANTTLSVIE